MKRDLVENTTKDAEPVVRAGSAKSVPLGRAAVRARDAILTMISDGVFPPNEKLPGERDLADAVGVSRSVLRDALAALEREGHLASSPWRGWFVRGHQMAERVELQSFTELARSRGLKPTSQILLSLVRPSSMEESTALAIAPAASVLETRRLRSLDGVPTCIDVSVIPMSRAAGINEVSLENASLYATLEEVSGVRIVRSDYRVRAGVADEEIARLLTIPQGAPVLIGEEVSYDTAAAAIILGQVTYRSDAYHFQATLFRRAAPGTMS